MGSSPNTPRSFMPPPDDDDRPPPKKPKPKPRPGAELSAKRGVAKLKADLKEPVA